MSNHITRLNARRDAIESLYESLRDDIEGVLDATDASWLELEARNALRNVDELRDKLRAVVRSVTTGNVTDATVEQAAYADPH